MTVIYSAIPTPLQNSKNLNHHLKPLPYQPSEPLHILRPSRWHRVCKYPSVKNHRKTLLISLTLLFTGWVHAQLDSHHHIPPIYYGLAEGGGSTSNFDRHYLVLSTPSADPVSVKVTDGAGNEVINAEISHSSPLVHLLGRLSGGAYQSTNPVASGNVVGTSKLNQVSSDGLVVEASAPVYANIRHQSGFQGASLTAKGCAALGQEFRVATMRNNDVVHDYRSLFFSAMATEDGTVVEIDQIKPGVVFTNTTASGDILTSEKITVTLNRGQSYVVGIKADQYASQGGTAPFNDVNGTRVRSNKPIVMNSGTVLGCPDRNNVGSRDMGFDQIAPVTRAGYEYVFVKGSASIGSDLETPILVAVEDDTEVFLNGSLAPHTNSSMSEGDYLFLNGEYTVNNTLHVRTSRPVLAWQTMAGANSPATPGLNFVPPLNEDIATSVDNIAHIDLIGEATVNIVARSGDSVAIDGSTPASGPLEIAGTPDWVLYSQKALTGNPTIQSTGAIAVSLVILKNPIGAGAYYSGYPDFKPLIQLGDQEVTLFPGVTLTAVDPSGGIFTDYEWFTEDGVSTGITGPSFSPPNPGQYYVMATSATGKCPPSPSAIFNVERYPEADLQLTKTISAQEVTVGSTVTFELTATNLGPDAATEIEIKDILPEGYTYVADSIRGGSKNSDARPDSYGLIWFLSELSAQDGENTATLAFQATVNAEGLHQNTASISADILDSDPLNNFGTAGPTTVSAPAPVDPEDPNVDPDCLCPIEVVEFEIRDLDILATFGVFPQSYDAARDVWHMVKDVLHCDAPGHVLEEEKRGFQEEDFYIAEDSEVIVTVIYDGATYYNSVAFYNAADPGSTWKTIWESFATGPTTPIIPGSSASLGIIPAGTELRFGLVMNGGKGGDQRIYQDAYLNPAGQDFVASNILLDQEDRPLIVAFEDQLFEGRDNDYNDVIFMVDIIPSSLGASQNDGLIANTPGLQSDRGSRGVNALLEEFGINDASQESIDELFEIPAGMTELTLRLHDDRSSMKFALAAYDYDRVSWINPSTPAFRELAVGLSTTILDDRSVDVNGEVTINPLALGLAGKTIGLLIIPNNVVDNFLNNPWRYTPKGEGDRTKRQPLFSLNNANPGAHDQYFIFSNTQSTLLAIEDYSRIDDLSEAGDPSDHSFDDIQIQITPALQTTGFHSGNYLEGSADPTAGFTGPDGYNNN